MSIRNSMDSQHKNSFGSRVGSGLAGLGTSVAATVAEFGAAGTGLALLMRSKDHFVSSGKKILPTAAKTMRRNPLLAFGFTLSTVLSVALERQSGKYTNKALNGKDK